MATVLPTRIEQVNDYSNIAGRQIIDALKTQVNNNPFLDVQKQLNTFLTNRENRRIADAVAQYNQGIEAGLSAIEALKGIDSYIAGSDEFRKQADKIRESRIRQDAEDRAKRVQAQLERQQRLTEEASALSANFQETINTLGPGGAAIWYGRNKDKLANNPYAAEKVMGLVNSGNHSLYIPESSEEPTTLTSAQIAQNRANAQEILDKFSATGTMEALNQYKDRFKSFEDFVNNYAAKSGDSGGSYSDLRDNFNSARVILEQKASDLGLPYEAVYWAIDRNIDPAFWWFRQDSVNVDPAIAALERLSKTYHRDQAIYSQAKQSVDLWKKIQESKAIETAQTNREKNLERIIKQRSQNLLSNEEANKLIAYENSMLAKKIQEAMLQKDIDKLIKQ